MNSETNNQRANQNLAEFLYGSGGNNLPIIDEPINVVAAPSTSHTKSGGIKDKQSLERLEYELNLLYNHFFTKTKACLSLVDLLKEIEEPNEKSDLAGLKELVYSELRWLKWGDKEFLAATQVDEMQWLKQLVVKTIGPKAKSNESASRLA